MYKMWYWALVERRAKDQFVANIPDLPDVVADGPTEKDALAAATQRAAEHVRLIVEAGERIPKATPAGELPRRITRAAEFNRVLIPVDVDRVVARPSATYKVQK
jgi:predicted RNase H-like HicB family nuclease